ncbi:GAF domain-containing protein [Deinococcus malanensis]|uniref:GAF domain-containing protein n=1 Tax=Deinococcus malanensis TaxID=1706855 RepID=UPI00363EA25F
MPLPPDRPTLAGMGADVASIKSLLDLCPTGAVLTDSSLRVLHINSALATLMNSDVHAARGQSLSGLLPGLPREVLDACEAALWRDQPQRDLRFDLISSEGPHAVRGRVTPVHDGHQQVAGLVVTFEDAAPATVEIDRLRRLQTITAALTRAVTANDVKAIILQQVVPATAAYAGSLIRVVDEATLYTLGTVGYDQTFELTWQRFPADEGFPGVAAIRARQPIFATLDDLQRDYVAVLPLLQPRTRAVAALPLMADGLVLGCLTLSFEQEGDIQADRQGHLLALAEVSSQALRRARQYDAEHAAHQRSALLAEAGTALAESLNVTATLERITTLAIQHVADWAAVFLPDDTGRMVVAAAAHPDPAKVGQLRWFLARLPHDPQASGSPAWVLQTGQAVLMPVVPPDIADAFPQSDLRDAFLALGQHSVINVPLTVQGRHIGVLGLATTHPSRTYGEADLELAQALAARAALALDNAQLHEAADHKEQRYRSLVDATRQAVWTNSPEGRMLGEQPGWAALTGQAQAEYEGYGWSDALHPEDHAPTLAAWQRAVATHSGFEMVHRVRGRTGPTGTSTRALSRS